MIVMRPFPQEYPQFPDASRPSHIAAGPIEATYQPPIADFSSSRITGDIAHLFDIHVTSRNVLISQCRLSQLY
ncbi:hypothetical protein RCCGEPOP_20155 [Rhizobium sp. Pop5]|nr:hypothetical protein RCCGEPOP_20155 [Rhizobium sp. Pop5]